jgi:hypothetical protein
MNQPILSIVIPTREGFAEHWLQELLKIKGEVEFILVHPPGMTKLAISDRRVQQINTSFRGEIIQRMTGFFNASGVYLLTINCDEYLNPDIVEITRNYFQKFPDSWVMRLARKNFKFGEKQSLDAPWLNIPSFEKLTTWNKVNKKKTPYDSNNNLLEIPIIPLENKFDLLCLIRQRKDHHGVHTENFDKKVWKTEMVQAAILDLSHLMIIFGPFKYVPFWCLDRLLGLFIQAKFYQSGKIIGHLLPLPEQIRIEDNPPEYSRKNRFYVLAEILLLRGFPQYGYFWNLIINHLREALGIAIRAGIPKFNREQKPEHKIYQSVE